MRYLLTSLALLFVGLACVETAKLPSCRQDQDCAAGQRCQSGVCGAADVDPDTDTADDACVCAAGQSCCAGSCRSLDDDPRHCGGCGVFCNDAELCRDGACVCPSAAGTAERACDSATETCCVGQGCFDLLSHRKACGACAHSCNPGERCERGACQCGSGLACAQGRTCCDGSCCASGQLCCGGVCREASDPLCLCGADGVCSAEQSCCLLELELEACIDTSQNSQHCGACAEPCAANQVCSWASCECQAGFGDCLPAAGCESRLLDDPANCGRCGKTCGAHALCLQGTCVCAATQAPCGDGQMCCEKGCVAQSLTACGACDRACASSPPNTSSVACVNASCVLECSTGWADCNGLDQDGCETALGSQDHCASCGNACGPGRSCVAGACVCSSGQCQCSPSQSYCGTACVELATDPQHCGGCGQACAERSNASRACVAGACTYTCNEGWGDCNASPSDGCETTLLGSASHCGGCGSSCGTRPQASSQCVNGQCQYACLSGWDDCNDSWSDGCETALDTASDCGQCGQACPSYSNASASCSQANCQSTCLSGWGDCDGELGNGCEVNLYSSLNHCGGCFAPCANTNTMTRNCNSGVCEYLCASGRGNCDSDWGNGCETNLNTELSHCGNCHSPCPTRPNASPSCSSGVCTSSCHPGWDDCDGDALGNGCEADLLGSSVHCGFCNNTCSPGSWCENGNCSCECPMYCVCDDWCTVLYCY